MSVTVVAVSARQRTESEIRLDRRGSVRLKEAVATSVRAVQAAVLVQAAVKAVAAVVDRIAAAAAPSLSSLPRKYRGLRESEMRWREISFYFIDVSLYIEYVCLSV